MDRRGGHGLTAARRSYGLSGYRIECSCTFARYNRNPASGSRSSGVASLLGRRTSWYAHAGA